jgi:hypothetical protein
VLNKKIDAEKERLPKYIKEPPKAGDFETP